MLFFGHKPIPKYTEDEHDVYDKACSRCNHTLGFPRLFLWMPRCPTSTQEEWDEYIQERKDEIKKDVEKKIEALNIIRDNERSGVKCWYPTVDNTITPPGDE